MNITILGCGVYGLALANSFLHNGNTVWMWSKFQKEVDTLRSNYLSLSFTTDLKEATRDADLVVIAIPVAFLEETMQAYLPFYQGQDILIASKGIEINQRKFSYEIVQKYLRSASIGVISGGTFALDMSNKKVMGLTLGTNIPRIQEKVKNSLASDFLKIQYTEDVIGVSVCGAIKNVMAIGFGILDGANYPPSSRFFFLTEAIYEIQYLIEKLGGQADTIMSYAGIDDIMMTCTSSKSRNYTLGKMLGEKRNTLEIEEYKKNTTIEGLGTSQAIVLLTKEKGLHLPISSMIFQILYENRNYMDLISLLEKKESSV